MKRFIIFLLLAVAGFAQRPAIYSPVASPSPGTAVTSATGTTGQVLVNGGTTAKTGAVTFSLASGLTGINSVSSTALSPLALGTGTSGAALTFASATNIGTFTAAPIFPGFSSTGTGAFTSAATSGLQLYNTADQTTNYERLNIYWASNVATVSADRLGSGSVRTLRLGSDGTSRSYLDIAGSGATRFGYTSASAPVAGSTISFSSSAANAITTGTTNFFALNPSYNQTSGTAANTDFLINRTETAVGSGDQMFQEMQVGGIRRWTLGSKVVATTDATATTLATIPVPASTTIGVCGYVVARRTGGVSGTAEDGAYYRVETVYKNSAGTATNIGTTVTVIGESQAGWDVTVTQSGGNILIQVTGAANNNISWMGVFTRNPISL